MRFYEGKWENIQVFRLQSCLNWTSPEGRLLHMPWRSWWWRVLPREKRQGEGRDPDTMQEEAAEPGLFMIFLWPPVQWGGKTTSARKLVPTSTTGIGIDLIRMRTYCLTFHCLPGACEGLKRILASTPWETRPLPWNVPWRGPSGPRGNIFLRDTGWKIYFVGWYSFVSQGLTRCPCSTPALTHKIVFWVCCGLVHFLISVPWET